MSGKQKNPDSTGYVIIYGFSLIIFLVILIVFIYYIAKSKGSTVEISINPCAIGECATSLYSGEKRCPSDTTSQIYYNPSFEVCNKKFACDNPITPYQISTDGGTSNTACTGTNICGCSVYPKCPFYAQVAFLSNGTEFYQLASFNKSIYPNPTKAKVDQLIYSIPPIIMQKSETNEAQYTCNVSFDNMKYSTPGCGSEDSPLDCMNKNTSTIGNPCIRGLLAYVVDDSSTFNPTATDNTMMCVSGETVCPENNYYVFDKMTNTLQCIT